MKCPVCDVDLLLADKQGIEIDYCPKCRGIWLDRGELDKIMDRSHSAYSQDYSEEPRRAPAPPAQSGYSQERYERPRESYGQPQDYHGRPDHPKGHYGHPHGHQQRKRKSFLEEIFDFD